MPKKPKQITHHDPVPIRAVPGLLMIGSALNTQGLKPNGTRPTTEIRKPAAAMDVPGNASGTAMYSSTLCVSCASVTESLYRRRRFTTRCLLQTEVHTHGTI